MFFAILRHIFESKPREGSYSEGPQWERFLGTGIVFLRKVENSRDNVEGEYKARRGINANEARPTKIFLSRPNVLLNQRRRSSARMN